MPKDNKLFQDIARLASSAVATAAGAKHEFMEFSRQQLETLLKEMQFVTREEFEVVKKIAIENRLRLEELARAQNIQHSSDSAAVDEPTAPSENHKTDQ